MDFQSALETFTEAWLATKAQPPAVTEDIRSHGAENLPLMAMKTLDGSSALGQHAVGDRPANPPSPSKKPASDTSVKTIAIRCLVEVACAAEASSDGQDLPSPSAHGGAAAGEKYAIVPCSCTLSELVKTALVNLGYPAQQCMGAIGFIQLKNWKPLPFSSVTDSETATVEDILTNVNSFATLKIKLPNPCSSEDLKDKLLQLLLSQSPDILRNTGCPITKESFEGALQGGTDLPSDVKDAFYKWYQERHLSSSPAFGGQSNGSAPPTSRSSLPQQQTLPPAQPSIHHHHHQRHSLSAASGNSAHHAHTLPPPSKGGLGAGLVPGGGSPSVTPLSALGAMSASHLASVGPGAPGTGAGGTSRSRLRISFDPDYEVPKLSRWFSECQHPSRQQMTAYLNELNAHPCRQNIKHLDLTNIMYWFKNARAAARRAGRALSHEAEGGDMSDEDGKGGAGEANSPNNASLAEPPILPNKNAVYVMNEPVMAHRLRGPTSHRDNYDDEEDDEEEGEMVMDCSPGNEGRDDTGGRLSDHRRPSYNESRDLASSQSSRCGSAAGQRQEAQDLSVKQETESVDEYSNGVSRVNGERENGVETGDDDDSAVRRMDEEDIEIDPANHTSGPKEEDGSGASTTSSSGSPGPSPNGFCGFYSPQLMAATAAGYPGFYPSFPMAAYLPTSQASSAAAVTAAAAALSAFTPKDASSHGAAGGGPTRHHSLPASGAGLANGPLSSKGQRERQKRHRAFIDPVSEIPKLEQWFAKETHPSHYIIEEICEELNQGEFRSRYPKLSPKNVQLWFKNHRAKVKRMRVGQLSAGMSGFDTSLCGATTTGGYYNKHTAMANMGAE